jgi:hypothetical protein
LFNDYYKSYVDEVWAHYSTNNVDPIFLDYKLVPAGIILAVLFFESIAD